MGDFPRPQKKYAGPGDNCDIVIVVIFYPVVVKKSRNRAEGRCARCHMRPCSARFNYLFFVPIILIMFINYFINSIYFHLLS